MYFGKVPSGQVMTARNTTQGSDSADMGPKYVPGRENGVEEDDNVLSDSKPEFAW
jgi:hypothetical protein